MPATRELSTSGANTILLCAQDSCCWEKDREALAGLPEDPVGCRRIILGADGRQHPGGGCIFKDGPGLRRGNAGNVIERKSMA
jgi:hypothetical protein